MFDDLIDGIMVFNKGYDAHLASKWDQVLFFASQLLTYSNKSKKESIERKLLELA
jgi:hypothetical protein